TSLILLLLVLAGATGLGQVSVSTDSPNTITSTTAFAAGTINNIGSGITERGFCYGLTINPDITGTKVFEAVSGGGAIGSYELQLASLTNPTTYHVRAYIISGGSPTYGSDVTFTTFPSTSYSYSCKAMNDYLVDANTYQFDVYIYSNTSPTSDLWLNNYQLGFEVWNVGSTATTLTGSYVSGCDPILVAGSKTPGTVVLRTDNSGGAHLDMVIAGPGATSTGVQIPYTSTGPGTRIGTFQLVYHSSPGVPAPFPNVKLNIVWDNDVLGKTVIYAISPPGAAGTVVNNTSFTAHLPYLGPGLPLNNYVCNSLVWKETGGTAWATGTNWFQNPSTISTPPGASTYTYIEKEGILNFPVVSTRTSPTCGTLEVDDGAKVTIASTGDLTVNGNMILGNTATSPLIIQSDASGTGSLIVGGTISGTGASNCQIQRYVDGSSSLTVNKYHFVSIPITSGTSNLFLDSYLYYFDESIPVPANNGWVNMGTSTSNPLSNTRGYMLYYPGSNKTYSFIGSMNNGAITASTSCTDASTKGWNLVPNPYPSSIDWNVTTGSGWTKTQIDNSVYVWNSTLATPQYASYVGGVGNAGGSQYIAPGQSFFVHTNITGSGSSLIMDNRVRVHNSVSFLKDNGIIPNLLRIRSTVNDGIDETTVRFTESATSGFDSEWDAYKLAGGPDAPQLSSVASDNTNLSINSLPVEGGNITLPLKFSYFTAGDVTFTASGMETFEKNGPIYLEDQLLNKIINLRLNPTYTFSYQPGNAIDRFVLHFSGVNGTKDISA
ncbi:MAG: hypothetical protein WCI92_20425, partial [Bacteroidota bacterium]